MLSKRRTSSCAACQKRRSKQNHGYRTHITSFESGLTFAATGARPRTSARHGASARVRLGCVVGVHLVACPAEPRVRCTVTASQMQPNMNNTPKKADCIQPLI